MIKKRGLLVIISSFILFVFPLVNAICPTSLGPGWFCNENDIKVYVGSGIICEIEDYSSQWTDLVSGREFPTMFSQEGFVYSCSDPANINDGNACCGPDTACKPLDSALQLEEYPNQDKRACIASTEQYCSDFKNEDDCLHASTQYIARNSIETNPNYGSGFCSLAPVIIPTPIGKPADVICWRETSCSCVWSGSCQARASNISQCSDNTTISSTSCIYNITETDNCETDGNIVLRWIPQTATAICQEATLPIPCTNIMRLDFFTRLNLITAIIILTLIYSIKISWKRFR